MPPLWDKMGNVSKEDGVDVTAIWFNTEEFLLWLPDIQFNDAAAEETLVQVIYILSFWGYVEYYFIILRLGIVVIGLKSEYIYYCNIYNMLDQPCHQELICISFHRYPLSAIPRNYHRIL